MVGFFATRIAGKDEEDGRPVKWEEIQFAFTRGAVVVTASGRRRRSIVAKWVNDLHFPSGAVFLRTRQGVYRSHLRTLREFESRVPNDFDVANQSVVANLGTVGSIHLGSEKPRSLRYDVEESDFAWPIELVLVSRNNVGRIRDRFAM